MAQQVMIAGAVFDNVPSIKVPDSQNVFHSFVDSSDATATATDIANGKTAYVNGSKITGEYVPGGLEYESGTYEPTSDTDRPTINFARSHTSRPFAVFMIATNETVKSANSNFFWGILNWYDAYNTTIGYGTISTYARNVFGYRTSSSVAYNGYTQALLTGTGTTALEYNVTSSAFYPYNGSTSRYWRKDNTYKWIAIWMPTT